MHVTCARARSFWYIRMLPRLPLELDNENTCVHQLFTRTRDRLDEICTNAKRPWIIVRYEQRDVLLCGIERMNLHARCPAHGISSNLPDRRIVESKFLLSCQRTSAIPGISAPRFHSRLSSPRVNWEAIASKIVWCQIWGRGRAHGIR